jgi:GTPase SAR1 family protein
MGHKHRRRIHVANLDPAAEHFHYDVAFDVRELISVNDVMEELQLGPNGSLVYCMEYLLQNMDWLQDNLDTYNDDEYLIIDCPGQIELYTHIPVMNKIIDTLRLWGYAHTMVSVFIVDATFVTDPAKFISGSLLALSAMISMQLPHVNVLSKCDLVEEASMDRILEMESALQLWDVLGINNSNHDNNNHDHAIFGDDGHDDDGGGSIQSLWSLRNHQLQPTPPSLSNASSRSNNAVTDVRSSSNNNNIDTQQQTSNSMSTRRSAREKKWHKLTEAICSLLDDYSMVGFIPLNINDEDSIAHVLATVDHAIQYGEDLEVRGADYDDDVGEGVEE